MRFCDYPNNLLREVCPEIEETDKRPEDFYETLAYLLAGMPLRHKEILLARFRDGKTLDECAKRLGVHRERVRQIESKALAHLREPIPQRYLKYGVKGVIEQEIATAYSRAGDAITESMENEINRHNEKIDREIAVASSLDLRKIGLSVRAYNSLTTRGCKTVYDVLNLTPTEFWRTRNLGEKTGAEVIDKLREMHFDCARLTNTRRY